MALTPKQQRFCEEYIVDLNATRAAIRAGYSENSSKQIGSENLSKHDVQEYIAELQAARSERTKIDADYVLTQAQKLHERCMQAKPVMRRNSDGEWVETGEYRFDSAGAKGALEIIGKHVNVQAFNERASVHHTGDVKLVERRIVQTDAAAE